jgi:hypothetical protein
MLSGAALTPSWASARLARPGLLAGSSIGVYPLFLQNIGTFSPTLLCNTKIYLLIYISKCLPTNDLGIAAQLKEIVGTAERNRGLGNRHKIVGFAWCVIERSRKEIAP